MNRPVLWWQARNPREQALVALMTVAVAAFIGWYGLFVPLRAARDAAVARRADAARDVAAVAAGVTLLRSGRGDAGPDGDSFATVITSSARTAGIGIARQQPGAAGTIEIGTDAVPTVELFRWLDTLHRRHGITPRQLRAYKADGRLRADLVFVAPAP